MQIMTRFFLFNHTRFYNLAGDYDTVQDLTFSSKVFNLFYRLDLDAWINEPPSDSSEDESFRTGQSIFVPNTLDDHR